MIRDKTDGFWGMRNNWREVLPIQWECVMCGKQHYPENACWCGVTRTPAARMVYTDPDKRIDGGADHALLTMIANNQRRPPPCTYVNLRATAGTRAANSTT
jgi:hypothetical protein